MRISDGLASHLSNWETHNDLLPTPLSSFPPIPGFANPAAFAIPWINSGREFEGNIASMDSKRPAVEAGFRSEQPNVQPWEQCSWEEPDHRVRYRLALRLELLGDTLVYDRVSSFQQILGELHD